MNDLEIAYMPTRLKISKQLNELYRFHLSKSLRKEKTPEEIFRMRTEGLNNSKVGKR